LSKKARTSDNIIQDLVNLWTSKTDTRKIRNEVDKWTRHRGSIKEETLTQ
jgi:hypothetical protein